MKHSAQTQNRFAEGHLMKITRELLTGIAVSVLSLGCAAAFADSPPAGFEHSSLVHYSDLNLNQQQDVARLYTRIQLAADHLCGPRSLTGINYKWADYQSCYSDTIAQAVARVGQPLLSAYARQRSSEPAPREIAIARQ